MMETTKKLILSASLLTIASTAVAQDNIQWRVAPDPMIPQEKISQIQLIFPPIDHAELLTYPTGVPLTVLLPDGTEKTVNGDWIDYDAGQVIGFYYDEPFTEPGEYSFRIAEGMIFNESADAWLPSIEFTMNIGKSFADVMTVSPSAGNYETLDRTVTLTFPGAAKVVPAADGVITFDRLDSPATTTFSIVAGETTNSVAFTIPEDFSLVAGGRYKALLPAGAVRATDAAGTEISLEDMAWYYTIVDTRYQFNPGPGTFRSLWALRLEFPGATLLDVAGSADDITFNGPDDDPEPLDIVNAVMSNYVYTRVESNTMPDGKYTYHVPAGTLTVDGVVYDKEINAVYTISKNTGIDSPVVTPDEDADLYTVQGAKAGRLSSGLKPGIYVGAGRKVIVR